jgi:hypothetical protein
MTRSMLALSALVVGLAAGCSESPYAVQVPPSCVSQNTAVLTFSNESVTNRPYDVLMDGAKLATVAAGATSDAFVVKALILHVVRFNFSTTDSLACALQIVTPDQCTTSNYYCRG